MKKIIHAISLYVAGSLLLLCYSCTDSNQKANTLVASESASAPASSAATSVSTDESGTSIDVGGAIAAVAENSKEDGSAGSYVVPITNVKDADVVVTYYGDGGRKCTIYEVEGMEGMTYVVCSECPPICDTNLDPSEPALPIGLLNQDWKQINLKQKEKMFAKNLKQQDRKSFVIDAATITALQKQGAAYVKAWPAHNKEHKPFMVLAGYDKKGQAVSKNRFYRTWKLCPPDCSSAAKATSAAG